MNSGNSLANNFGLWSFYECGGKLIHCYGLTDGTFDPGARVYFHDHYWYGRDMADVAPTNFVGPVCLIVFYLKS